jgi:hypothetical protein
MEIEDTNGQVVFAMEYNQLVVDSDSSFNINSPAYNVTPNSSNLG